MNTASKVIIGLLVGLLALAIIYARVQKTKALANLVLVEELREEVEEQRKRTKECMITAEFRRDLADKARMEVETVRAECERQLMALRKK